MISKLHRRAKLTDFGLIAVLGDEDSETKTAGTIAFFAPEMITSRHEGFSVKKADVWATGITLYFILFGTPLNRLCPKLAPSLICTHRTQTNARMEFSRMCTCIHPPIYPHPSITCSAHTVS
jgi:serine/threonine protein kinase